MPGLKTASNTSDDNDGWEYKPTPEQWKFTVEEEAKRYRKFEQSSQGHFKKSNKKRAGSLPRLQTSTNKFYDRLGQDMKKIDYNIKCPDCR